MSKLVFKSTVNVPAALIIAAAVHNARTELGLSGDTVITSGNDSKHSLGSLHYTGDALDIRVHGLSDLQVAAWAAGIGERLGPNYDVIIEALGTPNAHIHVEFDPDIPSMLVVP